MKKKAWSINLTKESYSLGANRALKPNDARRCLFGRDAQSGVFIIAITTLIIVVAATLIVVAADVVIVLWDQDILLCHQPDSWDGPNISVA
jgi:hypothetical protein